MIGFFSVLVAGLLLSAEAIAGDRCPAEAQGLEWASTCFVNDHKGRRVKPQYLKRLSFDRRGYTTVVISEPRELVAINRHGRVIVPGIMHTGDFDFPNAHGGIARFTIEPPMSTAKSRSSCGYFDSRNFRIIVPAEYDHCLAFSEGEALACKDCDSYCTEPDCQNRILVGGTGFILGLDGKIRSQRKLPDVNSACKKIYSSGVNSPHYAGGPARCDVNVDNPFNQLE